MAGRYAYAHSIEDDGSEYGSIGSRVSRDSLSIQEKPKTETCVGAACKKLSKAAKNIKKRFTRKKRKNSSLLPRDSVIEGELGDEVIRYSDVGSFSLGGRRKRRKTMKRKRHKHIGGARCKCYSCCQKRGGKRRRTRKKRKSRKRRKKRKTRRRR
jgi:hypothetical protein